MSPAYSSEVYQELAEYLHRKAGLYYSPAKYGELDRGISAAIRECNLVSEAEFLREIRFGLLTSPVFDSLMRALTIGETYFFRENKIFEVLKDSVIPHLFAQRKAVGKPLKVWSAACCTGEEPYTIAMVMKSLYPSIDSSALKIIGTDINSDFLERAKKGVYREWSFRGVAPGIKEKFFQPSGDEYRLDPVIRELVVFRTLNLIDDEYPSFIYGLESVDLIFCRNVLIYFSDETRLTVFQKMFNTLTPGGHLILSLTETAHQTDKRFSTSFFGGVSFFTKPEEKVVTKSAKEKPELPAANIPEKILTSLPKPKPSSPADTDSPAPLTLYDIVKQLMLDGKFNEILSLCSENIFMYPASAQERSALYIYIYRAAVYTGEVKHAITLFEEELGKSKTAYLLYFLLATLYADTNPLHAVGLLQRALFLDSDYLPARLLLSSLFRATGDEEKRQKELRILKVILDKRKDDTVFDELEGLSVSGIRAAVNAQLTPLAD